jgi:hypothetical protein
MSTVSIIYDLGRHGWSNFKLTVGDIAVDIGPFGYCTDALGDLVRAALMLVTSDYRVEVSFDGKPREWRLIIDEGWKPELRLRILSFGDCISVKRPETEGQLLIESHVTADDFARAVQIVAQGIWDTYGAAGYNEAWIGQRGFPLRGLKTLDAALFYDEPPPKTER